MRAIFERVRGSAKWPALWLCLIIMTPAIAVAQVTTYLCQSMSGAANPTYVTVDNREKSVTLEESTNAGIKCIMFVKNGVYGQTYIGPTADLCAMAMGADNR